MQNDAVELTGHVTLRPVRIGFLFKPELESLAFAIKQATAAWGGMYFPFIDPTDEDHALSMAAGLDVDALYAVDNDAASQRLARSVGYSWQGRNEWGPLGYAKGPLSGRIQTIDWLLEDIPKDHTYTHFEWADQHPMANVLLAVYGKYPEVRDQAAEFDFRSTARSCTLNQDDFIARPEDRDFSPIQLTSREIAYRGHSFGSGIVVMRPDDARAISLFWNLRASGLHVLPWVIGHEAVSLTCMSEWLPVWLDKKVIPHSMRGDGVDMGPVISVHLPDEMDAIPADLENGLKVRKVGYRRLKNGVELNGWRGRHPFHTEFGNFFKVESSRRKVFDIGMPKLTGGRLRRGHEPGFVIADIAINSVTGLTPDAAVVMPGLRELSPLVDMRDVTNQRLHRVTEDGRAVAVRAGETSVEIGPVRSMAIIETLMSGHGWTYQQTDNGKFSTRLIEKLGGSTSYVANQPGIRTALTKAASSHSGLHFPALMSHAKKHRGAWPDILSPIGFDEYPAQVIRYLLARKALQPVLPVRCPDCTVEVTVMPEDLRSDYSCELCGSQVPLGLALGMHVRNEWAYKIAGNIAPDRLSETLPVMATASIFSGYRSASANYPYALGVSVRAPGRRFEVDIVMTLAESSPPLVVIGEVKSYMDWVTAEDLDNLRFLQTHLRDKGIDCYILAATLKDELADETVAALREICRDVPRSFGAYILPVFPIVLTGRDLSVPPFHENNPMEWQNPGTGLSSLAIESCRRNIGLVDAQYQWDGDRMRFVSTWTE